MSIFILLEKLYKNFTFITFMEKIEMASETFPVTFDSLTFTFASLVVNIVEAFRQTFLVEQLVPKMLGT